MAGATELVKFREVARGTSHPSPLLQTLLSAFCDEGVSYCYFKSARRLDLALSGESDLDLLVARKDRDHVLELLAGHGFRHWRNVPARDHPAIMSFLGYDEAMGKIHHVHVHFRLVLGHTLLKDLRLPLEKEFLARSIVRGSPPVRTLEPADEAFLLLVRAHVEFYWLDPTTWRQRKKIRQKFIEDFADRAKHIDREVLLRRIEQIFSPRLAGALVSVFPMKTSQPSRALRAAIFKELSPYRTYNRFEANLRHFFRTTSFVFAELNRRVFMQPRVSRRLAPGGGVVVSFVGVDGSGKSTQVSAVRTWLANEIDVVTYYFGTGDGRPSIIFLPFKLISPLIAVVLRARSSSASTGLMANPHTGFVYSFLLAAWGIVVALDKRHKIISARRAASRGLVVLTDRYPQNEIASFNDGPILSCRAKLPEWLCRLERSVYELAYRMPPDLVIKLRATEDMLVNREPSMDRLRVRRLVAWLEELKFPGARIASVDATCPLGEVTDRVRSEIWKLL